MQKQNRREPGQQEEEPGQEEGMVQRLGHTGESKRRNQDQDEGSGNVTGQNQGQHEE